MSDESIQITKEKKQELEEELKERKTKTRPEILEKLQYAKSLGDLSENAEYHAARDAQGKNESRIKEIEATLKNATVIEKQDTDEIGLTSNVTIQKEGEDNKRDFTLVSATEADMAEGKLSVDSPIGAALVGKKEGDTAEIETPSGTVIYHIVSVS